MWGSHNIVPRSQSACIMNTLLNHVMWNEIVASSWKSKFVINCIPYAHTVMHSICDNISKNQQFRSEKWLNRHWGYDIILWDKVQLPVMITSIIERCHRGWEYESLLVKWRPVYIAVLEKWAISNRMTGNKEQGSYYFHIFKHIVQQ